MGKLSKLLLLGASGALAYTAMKRHKAALTEHFFEGLAVVVTGGASGIGRAIALELVERGALVLAVDADGQALERMRLEYPLATLQLDMTDPAAPGELVEQALRRLGGLDVVFSNHGIAWAAPFLVMGHADVDRLIDVNFSSHVRLTRALVPFFQERGSGVIAFTGSLSAYVSAPMLSVYSGTKAGLNQFVSALRRELGSGSGVQLTVVHPNVTRTGLIETGLWDQIESHTRLQTPEQVARSFVDGVAIGRKEVFVQVQDVAIIAANALAPMLIERLYGWTTEDDFRNKSIEALKARGLIA